MDLEKIYTAVIRSFVFWVISVVVACGFLVWYVKVYWEVVGVK